MKKIGLFALLIAFVFSSAGLNAAEDEKEKIKQVIGSAYVEGLQNAGNIEDIEKGFHPGFNLLVYKGDMMDKLPIYNWVEMVKKRKAQNPEPVPEDKKVTVEYENIDITGTAAVAKIHLYKEGKHLFTDYLSLYKFNDDWKIVGKIYYRIPE